MATRLVCDGCAGDLTTATARTLGRLDPVAYCADCGRTWDTYVAEEAAQRVALVTAFETWRAARLAALKAGGLAVLPDEG